MSQDASPSTESSDGDPAALEGPTGFAPVTDNVGKSPTWLPWAGIGFFCAALLLFAIHTLTPGPSDAAADGADDNTADVGSEGAPEEAPEPESDGTGD